jgi:hypothetical protein
MERLKTNPFQLPEKAFPGNAKKLMLLTKVAKIDIPMAQAGSRPPPVVKSLEVRFRNEKETPNQMIANM